MVSPEFSSGDQRPVPLLQMVNMLAGQSVDLANPNHPETEEEDLPPAILAEIALAAEHVRDVAMRN